MAISITSRALEYTLKLLSQYKKPYALFGIKSGGCSGFEYTMNLVESVDTKYDVKLHDNVYLDAIALMQVSNMEIDYAEDLLKTGYIFNNKTAQHSCGCGKSFG